MKIILLKDVKGSGKKDQIVDVKDGFANFLIKNGSAKPVTSKNLNELNNKNSAKEFHKQEEKDKAIKISEKLNGRKVAIELKSGKDGGLFGSVTTKDISDKILEVFGVEVDKHKVCLDKNIKECGTYEVKIKLYPQITSMIVLEVVSEEFCNRQRKIHKILDGKNIVIEFKSEVDDEFLGSVSTKDISDKILKVFGIEVDKRKICLDKNIKECGTYEVKIKLYPEITATIVLEVVSK